MEIQERRPAVKKTQMLNARFAWTLFPTDARSTETIPHKHKNCCRRCTDSSISAAARFAPKVLKQTLFILFCAVGTGLAADTPADKTLLEELAPKARAAAANVPPAENLLPPSTLAFVTVPDWQRMQIGFSNSMTGQLWADLAMKAFKEKFFEKFSVEKIQPFENELGFQFTNFLNLARGQFTVAIVSNGWDGRSGNQPGVLWLMDVKENSSQLKTNLADLRKKWTESGRKMRAEKIRDVEFITVIVDAAEIAMPTPKIGPGPRPAPDAARAATRTVEWVIGQSGPLLIVSDAAKDVEKVLALQTGVSTPALAEQPAFVANSPALRDSQIFAWINVKPIMATLARSPAQPHGEGGGALGSMPTMEKILHALGLSSVQSITFYARQMPDGSLANISVRVPESERKGLFRILAVDAKDASPPPFLPADAAKFSRWRIDLQQGWTTIENALVEISPQFASLPRMILDVAGKDKDPNFDFRKQLLANLGDDLMFYEGPRPTAATNSSSAPSLTLIGSKNAEQMAASFRAVTSIFPPDDIKYNERDFLGHKVYSLVLLPSPILGLTKRVPLTYSASGSYVAVSTDSATVEEFLRRGVSASNPLRETPALSAAAQQVGGTASGYFSFENQREHARAAFESASNNPLATIEMLGAGQFINVLSWLGADTTAMSGLFDPALLPGFDKVAKYFNLGVSAVTVTPETITFRTFTSTPPALRK
jgi:hypothetical protein